MTKHFLVEGHRPGIDWEKQTRVVEARTLAEAATAVENFGIEISSISFFSASGNIAEVQLRRCNPSLFAPWQTEVPK